MKNSENNKKRVLLCTGSFNTGAGGVASYAHDFIDAFNAEYQFAVITGDNYENASEKYEVTTISTDNYSKKNAIMLLKKIEEYEPDLIINSGHSLMAIVTPYVDNHIKIISISHFTDGRLAWAAGMNGNYVDNIVTLSSFAKKYIIRKFDICAKDKVSVVYNYMSAAKDLDVQKKKSAQVLKIVYPGGHSSEKSAEVVCLAINKLLKTKLNFELFWLGSQVLPGAGWPFTVAKTVSDCLNCNDKRIKHIGSLKREDAQKILLDANIFLLPSRGEGCPISLIEAMRGGCISIISDAKHGSLEIVENQKDGFIVKQGSASDIVRTIDDIIVNHTKYLSMYDYSIEKFKSSLEYSVWLKKMSNILQKNYNHKKRKKYTNWNFYRDVSRMKLLNVSFWLKDRLFIQPYQVICFNLLSILFKNKKNILYSK